MKGTEMRMGPTENLNNVVGPRDVRRLRVEAERAVRSFGPNDDLPKWFISMGKKPEDASMDCGFSTTLKLAAVSQKP
jgi:hypothetical protein